MKYQVEIVEKTRVYAEIEAASAGAAEDEARRRCEEGELVVGEAAERVEREYRVVGGLR